MGELFTKSQRKFIIASFFSVASTVALFADKLSGGEYVALAGVVLGLYATANVVEKAVSK